MGSETQIMFSWAERGRDFDVDLGTGVKNKFPGKLGVGSWVRPTGKVPNLLYTSQYYQSDLRTHTCVSERLFAHYAPA
jgi:hypothetical protein